MLQVNRELSASPHDWFWASRWFDQCDQKRFDGSVLPRRELGICTFGLTAAKPHYQAICSAGG